MTELKYSSPPGRQMPHEQDHEFRPALLEDADRLCGLVVRVSGYRYTGLGFDSRRYQIF